MHRSLKGCYGVVTSSSVPRKIPTSGLLPSFEPPSVNGEEPWYSSPGVDPLSSFCHIDFNSLWHNSTSYRPCHLAFLPASWGFSPRMFTLTIRLYSAHHLPIQTSLSGPEPTTRNSPSSPFLLSPNHTCPLSQAYQAGQLCVFYLRSQRGII